MAVYHFVGACLSALQDFNYVGRVFVTRKHFPGTQKYWLFQQKPHIGILRVTDIFKFSILVFAIFVVIWNAACAQRKDTQTL